MTQPKGKYTIPEAAEIWISMIQAPETKATQEQKDSLIAQIRTAAPSAKANGVGYAAGVPAETRILFVDACNAIKQAMRSAK